MTVIVMVMTMTMMVMTKEALFFSLLNFSGLFFFNFKSLILTLLL